MSETLIKYVLLDIQHKEFNLSSLLIAHNEEDTESFKLVSTQFFLDLVEDFKDRKAKGNVLIPMRVLEL